MRVVLLMFCDRPHGPSRQLGVDLLRHGVILLDSESDGIQPVTVTGAEPDGSMSAPAGHV
jgi:hypothetical protein